MAADVDKAIADTEPDQGPGKVTVRLKFDGDRTGLIELPGDLKESEWRRLTVFLLGTVAPDLIKAQEEAAAEAAASGLVVVRPTLVIPH